MKIDGDTQQRILYDIAGEISVAKSSLKYTDEMLAFRETVEAEYEAFLDEHPDAELYVPPELPRADDKVDAKKPPGKSKKARALEALKRK
jgi:hypothetical protein